MRSLMLLTCVVSPLLLAAEPQTGDKEKPAPKAAAKARVRPETFTDPEKAGPDFLIQGEYLGDGAKGGRAGRNGAQVIAEGDGKFTIKILKGGLPGDGWDGKTTARIKVASQNGQINFDQDGWTGSLGGGKLTLTREEETVVLERVVRTSPTAGKKPPAGAIVLFDGANATAWDKGKIVENNLLQMGTQSVQKFDDFTLHVEFRSPYMPKATGQGRGNSGVYMQGRYEVQILDSFGLDGKDNECGAVYSLAAPSVNMCYPPLSWQTFDIDYDAARYDQAKKKTADAVITVRHNGVLVHDKYAIKTGTTASVENEGPEPGPILLQNHGNPVYFRNIWLVEKK